MSAFIVSNKHINSLLSYANAHQGGKVTFNGDLFNFAYEEDLQRMANILVKENYRSYNYRYPREKFEPRDIKFHFETPKKAVNTLKACECYDYQCCETPDYKNTTACKIIDYIRGLTINNLPGYNDADWMIE